MLGSPLHESRYLRYSVEIVDMPMHKCAQTAIVNFYDDNNKRVTSHKFGVVSKEEIYELIDNSATINLNGAYVKDFSLTEYRTNKGLDDQVYIKMVDFKARKTFFDCDTNTDFSNAEFLGDKTMFEASIFGNGLVNFMNANFGHGEVSFKKAKFGSGSTSFRSAKFGEGLISFNNCNFGTGDLNFVDADFSMGDVDYKNTYFGDGNVDFKFAKFSSGDITFERASFGKGKKDFKNVEFGGGKIDFRRIEFSDGDVSFEGVEFGDGKVSFRSSVFGAGHKKFDQADFGKGEVQFDGVDFGTGTISFNQAKAMTLSFLGCHLNSYMDLRLGECTLLNLKHTIVRDILDVKPEGEKVTIKEMNLADMRILGRLFINWRENNVADLIYSQKDTSMFQKADQFRILKENFRNNGQYEDEDAAYLEFRRCESKAILEASVSKGKMSAFGAYPVYYFQKYVFDYIGRYATAPTRVLNNMMLTFFFFSVVYYFFSISPGLFKLGHVVAGGTETVAFTDPSLGHLAAFGNCLYYSGITFFTIGYGDYFASGWLKPIAVFEGFTGVFLMSYFTVAFVRKILR
ncbi:MAG: potassium channel family protein [Bacteroidia bacterium]|nr:potassium channel family protein [Bacteroidia bacterium]